MANEYPDIVAEGRDKTGNSALHVAIYNGYYEMAEKILRKGGNPNVQNKKGNTPLHIAFQMNHEK